eukprot:556972-Prymnesium_polylepis.2
MLSSQSVIPAQVPATDRSIKSVCFASSAAAVSSWLSEVVGSGFVRLIPRMGVRHIGHASCSDVAHHCVRTGQLDFSTRRTVEGFGAHRHLEEAWGAEAV